MFKKILRGIKFLARYLVRNPRYTFFYLLAFWRPGYAFQAKFLTIGEVMQGVKGGKSIIRLGDGEINLMLGLRNHYQKFDPRLQQTMFDIVRSYRHDAQFILAVPRFINCTNSELAQMGKRYVWLPLKVMFGLYFNKQVSYLDAHSFYYDDYFESVVGSVIGTKKVILVTKQETIDFQRQNQKLPWRDVRYIAGPSDESLGQYQTLLLKIRNEVSLQKKTECVVLFALGPVGKMMAFDLIREGYQVIDIGKVAEVMYTGQSIEYII